MCNLTWILYFKVFGVNHAEGNVPRVQLVNSDILSLFIIDLVHIFSLMILDVCISLIYVYLTLCMILNDFGLHLYTCIQFCVFGTLPL